MISLTSNIETGTPKTYTGSTGAFGILGLGGSYTSICLYLFIILYMFYLLLYVSLFQI